jgi:hypothetical protein
MRARLDRCIGALRRDARTAIHHAATQSHHGIQAVLFLLLQPDDAMVQDADLVLEAANHVVSLSQLGHHLVIGFLLALAELLL